MGHNLGQVAKLKRGAKRGVESRMKYGAEHGVKIRVMYGVIYGVKKLWGGIWGTYKHLVKYGAILPIWVQKTFMNHSVPLKV